MKNPEKQERWKRVVKKVEEIAKIPASEYKVRKSTKKISTISPEDLNKRFDS